MYFGVSLILLKILSHLKCVTTLPCSFNIFQSWLYITTDLGCNGYWLVYFKFTTDTADEKFITMVSTW